MLPLQYHASTKHYFNRFAPSLGYLDWANQPDPFRRYQGAPLVELPRVAAGIGATAAVPYPALYDGTAPCCPFDRDHLGELLRCAFGLSAWKAFSGNRWALRVNPSSGNLHPTEAYLVTDGSVFHYAPREHALEHRATVEAAAWTTFAAGRTGALVGLTSIHWREAWKYGQRAFRYCQHDTGHAIAALRLAAAMLGWRVALLERWGTTEIGALLGVDPDAGPEAEEPECLLVVTPEERQAWADADPAALTDAARRATWLGRPNQLSRTHVEWPAIDRVAEATRYGGSGTGDWGLGPLGFSPQTADPRSPIPDPQARAIILARRSAVSFDGRSQLSRAAFLTMFSRLQPGAAPWDAIGWPPQVNLAVFVHRVEGLTPGLYAWLRDPSVRDEWQAAMRPEFLWEPADANLSFLLPFDMTWPAARVSCDQDIAADGYFSLGMIARCEPALGEYGDWFYRRLFWECGMIGQVLYLEAEAAGGRGTGIGCFYDDPVHEMLGLTGETWQSLYHFSMGRPVDDPRITDEPGYPWEAR